MAFDGLASYAATYFAYFLVCSRKTLYFHFIRAAVWYCSDAVLPPASFFQDFIGVLNIIFDGHSLHRGCVASGKFCMKLFVLALIGGYDSTRVQH